MKLARTVLWILFPVAFIIYLFCLFFGFIKTLFIANLSLALILCLPITAMLLQTIMNKDKNPTKYYFVIKMTAITYLYIMVFFLFASVR